MQVAKVSKIYMKKKDLKNTFNYSNCYERVRQANDDKGAMRMIYFGQFIEVV